MNNQLLNDIEKVLNIEFYEWQRNYLLKEPIALNMKITGRRTGKTLVRVIEKLFESTEPLDLRDRRNVLISSADWWCCENTMDKAIGHPYMNWYKNYLKEIYERLNKGGIRTREVIF